MTNTSQLPNIPRQPIEKSASLDASDVSQLYWEPQQGGLCRMHALNAFFGCHKITPELFSKYCIEYDADMVARYNSNVSSSDFDIVNSDQANIISWILKKHGVWSQYYALNELFGQLVALPKHSIGNFIFVYNDGHIWGIKKIGEQVWVVDSMSGGPQLSDFKHLGECKNIGFIIPVKMQQEFYLQIKRLKEVVPADIASIRMCLSQLNREKKILGNIEIPLNRAVDILEWQEKLYPKANKKYQPIYDLVADYNKFLAEFTNGNYLNLDLVQKYLPKILYSLRCC